MECSKGLEGFGASRVALGMARCWLWQLLPLLVMFQAARAEASHHLGPEKLRPQLVHDAPSPAKPPARSFNRRSRRRGSCQRAETAL
jgi:hypothetical protein